MTPAYNAQFLNAKASIGFGIAVSLGLRPSDAFWLLNLLAVFVAEHGRPAAKAGRVLSR